MKAPNPMRETILFYRKKRTVRDIVLAGQKLAEELIEKAWELEQGLQKLEELVADFSSSD